MSAIEWHTRMGYALDSAQSEKKPILLDFFNPHCIGCQQMDKVTFPQEKIINFINSHFIPLRINANEGVPPDHHHPLWTPTIAVLNQNGDEIQRTVGFMGPEELLSSMHLGLGKARLDAGKYDTAMIHFKSLLESSPKSGDIPEALFFSGVTLFKESNNPGKLKETYERLAREYPDSRWTKRAYPYRLL